MLKSSSSQGWLAHCQEDLCAQRRTSHGGWHTLVAAVVLWRICLASKLYSVIHGLTNCLMLYKSQVLLGHWLNTVDSVRECLQWPEVKAE